MEIKLNKDDVIITQDDTDSTYMYVVIRGELSAHKTIDNSEIFCNTFNKGDIFGEVSMILGKPRSATIKVTSKEAVLKRLDKNEFLKEIKKNPLIAWNLLKKLASQTQKFDDLRSDYLKKSS